AAVAWVAAVFTLSLTARSVDVSVPLAYRLRRDATAKRLGRSRLRGRRCPLLDLGEHVVELELRRLPVDDLVAHADDEHATRAGLELHAFDALTEPLEDALLHVHGPREVTAGHAVLDL